ncbi:hypothetical protein, partial [Xanthomonas oryzae]|uniref:hypothetical protein n=1 Tax=Xanthomonas oryzae TaxID=347 RepID=UPI001C4A90AA
SAQDTWIQNAPRSLLRGGPQKRCESELNLPTQNRFSIWVFFFNLYDGTCIYINQSGIILPFKNISAVLFYDFCDVLVDVPLDWLSAWAAIYSVY